MSQWDSGAKVKKCKSKISTTRESELTLGGMRSIRFSWNDFFFVIDIRFETRPFLTDVYEDPNSIDSPHSLCFSWTSHGKLARYKTFILIGWQFVVQAQVKPRHQALILNICVRGSSDCCIFQSPHSCAWWLDSRLFIGSLVDYTSAHLRFGIQFSNADLCQTKIGID